MSFWTLVYTPPGGGGSTELPLGPLSGAHVAGSDWGIDMGFERLRQNRTKGTVRLKTVEGFDPAAGLQFAFDGQAKIYSGRTAIGVGGTLWFAGYFDDPRLVTNEQGHQWVEYELHDVFWFFERLQFKQYRNQFAGWIGGLPANGPILNPIVLPEIYLGEKPDETRQTNGQQCGEVIAWVNECYNPTRRGNTLAHPGLVDPSKDVVQAGTIDPQAWIPVTRVNTTFCSEIMVQALRWSPDSIVFVDSTTTPPTCHVRTVTKWSYVGSPPTFVDYTNLAEVTINITADQERDILLQQRQALKLAGVIIYFRSSLLIGNVWTPQITVDKFPNTITDFDPDCSSHVIELAGYKLETLQAAVVATAIPSPTTGTDADWVPWWQTHDATLRSPNVDPSSIVIVANGPVTVKDSAGVDVNVATYPNELVKDLPDTTKANVKVATVRAFISYNYTDPSTGISTPVLRETAKDIRLTDAISKTYQMISEFDNGEGPLVGLAEQVYRSANVLQSAGKITFTKAQLRTDISLGNRLKLVGPTTTFTNIVPQSIRERPVFGETAIEFSPIAPMDVDLWMEIARGSRLRVIYQMPSGRASGNPAGGATNIGQQSQLADTTHGPNGGGSALPIWL